LADIPGRGGTHSLLHLGSVATKFKHLPARIKDKISGLYIRDFQVLSPNAALQTLQMLLNLTPVMQIRSCPVKLLTSIKRVTLLAAESNRQYGIAEEKKTNCISTFCGK
jgi:hypothetical protein